MDYNRKYYRRAVIEIKDLQYYYGDLIGDVTKVVLRYFPSGNVDEIRHAVEWAVANVFNGGCELETL